MDESEGWGGQRDNSIDQVRTGKSFKQPWPLEAVHGDETKTKASRISL